MPTLAPRGLFFCFIVRSAGTQGLKALRYLLREVPLWALCRFEWQVSEARRLAAAFAPSGSNASPASVIAAIPVTATDAAAAAAGEAAAPTAAAPTAAAASAAASAASAGGGQGGSAAAPGVVSQQPAVPSNAHFIPAGGDARLGQRDNQAERGREGNPRLVRHFWSCLLYTSPSPRD